MKYSEVLTKRRTVYSLGRNVDLSNDEIEKIVEHAVKYTPSSFNSQSSRVAILFNNHHEKLWDIVEGKLKEVTPADKFDATKSKMSMFRSGYATILFFEDMSTVKGLAENMPLYADNFFKWSTQSSAMLQINIWNELAINNIGASLQHYNPLIDSQVKEAFGIDDSWELNAQMVIGSIEAAPGEKEFIDINSRLKVFK